MRVLVRGEVRYPGFYKFPSYKSDFFLESQSNDDFKSFESQKNIAEGENESRNQSINNSINIKRASENITTISDVIRKAGGITAFTDLSRIEIIRDIPLGKGGGKKEPLLTSILI